MSARLTATCLIALTFALPGCGGGNGNANRFAFKTATPLGKTIPIAERKLTAGFTGTLLTGGSISLSQDAGKVVVINFWAQWCPPCVIETPQLDSVYRTDRVAGVDIIGVDTKDLRSKAEAFVKDNDISYPMVYDEPGAVAVALGHLPIAGLPFSLLLDKHQRVAAVYLGPITPKDLQPVLNQLRAEA